MAGSRDRRMAKELADIQADKDNAGVFAAPRDGSNLTELLGTFAGPPDTPYAGGTFEVEIKIPDNYPFKPPVMKFKTKIWHPNVSSQTGAICLDTLSTGWSPVQTIKTALISIRMLLVAPNPKDPQDAEVAKQLMENPQAFAEKAHRWAVAHAGAPENDSLDLSSFQGKSDKLSEAERYGGYNKSLVDRFTGMGFPVEQVVETFGFHGVPKRNGDFFELDEGLTGDIVARLLGES